MAATTIDQYVTPRDSQVIFFPPLFLLGKGGARLTYRFRLLSWHKSCWLDMESNKVSCIFSLLKVSKKEKRLLPLFDDVQDPWEEVGHVSIQSRKAWPSATFCHKFKIFIFISLFYFKKKMKRKLIPIPPETTPVKTKTPSWATTKGPPLSPCAHAKSTTR